MYTAKLKNIVGDMLVSAACIAYMGAFPSEMRHELITSWVKDCQENQVPITPSFRFVHLVIALGPGGLFHTSDS